MNIKNPALIGALGLIALVLGLAGWYMSTHPAPGPRIPEAPPALETDVPARINEEGAFHSIDASYPTRIVFPLASRIDAGMEAEAVMEAWVKETVGEFRTYVAENEAAIAEFQAQGEEAPASLASSYLLITYEKKTSPRTITYLFSSATYTGGAHGIEVPVSFTFERTTGRQLMLADLFAPESGYLARLSDIARRELPDMMADYANIDFIMSGTAPTEDNFQTFYLTDTRIVFLFPPYQVAPYVAGTVSLPIERKELTDVLQPEFQVE